MDPIKVGYICKWEFEYDEENCIVSEELVFPEAKKPSQGFYYQYDEEGNHSECNVVDYAYDIAHAQMSYKYEDDRLGTKIKNGNVYEFFYEEPERIYAMTSTTDIADRYIYELSETGKVLSIEQYSSSEPNDTTELIKCSYDEKERINSLVFEPNVGINPEGFDGHRYTFTYKYDEVGRFSEIIYNMQEGNKEKEFVAKFVYKDSTRNGTAYSYNDDGDLVAKYVYQYNENGSLESVSIYYNRLLYRLASGDDFIWGTTYLGVEHSYPGGELPDNFLEWF